jgi:hypothetical protein
LEHLPQMSIRSWHADVWSRLRFRYLRLRQVVMRGNGHARPAFLISNDKDCPRERIAGDDARRWRVENVISEAVKFSTSTHCLLQF